MAEEVNNEVVETPVKPEFSQDELDTIFFNKNKHIELPPDLKAKVDADNSYHEWLKANPQNTVEETNEEETTEETTTETTTEGTTTEETNNDNTLKMPASLSAMLTEMGITEFNDEVVTKIKSKFQEADEIPVLREALRKKDELLSVKPEETYGAEIVELAEFTKKFKLPVKAAASLLGEIKSYDPSKDDSTTALMIQFKMDNPDYKGTDENLKEYIESIYEIDPEDTADKFIAIKQAKLNSDGSKAIARINEVKAALSSRPAAADYEAILNTQKTTWSPVVKAILGAKEGIPSINFEYEGEKYSIGISKESVAAMEDEILDAVRGMDVKDQKSIDQAYKIIQAKYLQKNLAKIIHDTAKGLKTAHAKEVEALNKAKEAAVKQAVKDADAKYIGYKPVDGKGRNLQPAINGNLSHEQIMVNNYLTGKGKPAYYKTGKEPWKDFKNS